MALREAFWGSLARRVREGLHVPFRGVGARNRPCYFSLLLLLLLLFRP